MDSATERYWASIAEATDLAALREAIALDQGSAPSAFADIQGLLAAMEPFQESTALDLLRWLGAELAEAGGNVRAAAALQARRLQFAAKKALQEETREEAAALISEAAMSTVAADDPEDAVHSTVVSTVLLFRMGESERGLELAEKLLEAVEARIFETRQGRSAIYEVASLTAKAPAGDRWASVLARIERGMRHAGDAARAAMTASQLAGLLVRSGAYEDCLELLADTGPDLRKVHSLQPNDEWTPIRETRDAYLWRARALDLRGSEAEAEKAYRAHPAFADPADTENPELARLLVEHLIENERLQEALNTLESSEPEDAAYRPLWRALLAKIYALLNRPEAASALLGEAASLLQEEAPLAAGASEFMRLAAEGTRALGKKFEPDELIWHVHLTMLEAAVLLQQTTTAQAETARGALAWARRFGNRAMESRCLVAQADLECAEGNAKEALRLLQEALACELTPGTTKAWMRLRKTVEPFSLPEELRRERFRRSRSTAGVGMQIQLSLGRAQLATGEDPTQALDSSITAARKKNRRLTLYAALAAKAGWLRSTGRVAEARSLWDEAAGVLENLRADLGTIESQIGLLKDRESVYAELLTGAIETADAELALRLMERAKGRAFLEQIQSGQSPAPLSEEKEAQARELRKQLVRLLGRQTSTEADGTTQLELTRVKDQMAFLYREDRQRAQPAAGAASKDAVRISEAGTTVIEYFVVTEGVFAVVAHRGTLPAPAFLPVARDELEQILESLQFELAVRERCRSLEALYTALFAPLEDTVRGASHLLIIPHDVLHQAPFHAFRGPGGLYLAQRFTIQYAPSVAVAQEAVRRPWTDHMGAGLVLAADKIAYSVLPPLAFASVETEEIGKALPRALVLQSEKASRRNLMKQEQDYEVLHCACHGEYDTDDPLLSRLYLADGPIYGYEIERLPFRARIAVLSACESGVQKRLAGDETFGLVRALLCRGFETVIASLWKVADESTAQLMGDFYRQRASGARDAAAALRSAQLQLLASKQYSHPFYWAPYFVAGRLSENIRPALQDREQP